jgi:hypothetical protein
LSNISEKKTILDVIARNFALFYFVLGSLSFALPSQTCAAGRGTTAPGTYRDWNGDIDEVTIFQTFRADSYNDIVVESIDSSGVTLPNPRENTYQAVQSALRLMKPAFIEGLQLKLRHKPADAGNVPRGKGQGLVIRARLSKLDPGSQAARYWGFGAGAVKIAMTGEIVDAASGKVLVRFRQERRSGFGAFGGGYGALFTRTVRQIGGDIASLINAF